MTGRGPAPAPYRALLRLLPRRFRARHGAALERAFADALAASRGSAVGRVRTWLAAVWDVARGAVVLRLRSRAVVQGRVLWSGEDGMRLETWARDVGQALRRLARKPGFTAVAVLTLGLGIGAVTLVFSAVNGVLLKPLPYQAADRIGILWHDLGDGAQSLPALHPLDWRDYRDRSETMEAFTIAGGGEVTVTGDGAEPELMTVGDVAWHFFDFFGVEPALGRDFRPEEDVANGPAVLMLSHRVWQRRYGGDPSVIGRTVRVEGTPHEVVGVLPADFTLHLPPEAFRLRDADIWRPVQIRWGQLPPRNFTGFTGFTRLAPGVSWAQAQEEVRRMAAQLREEHAVHASANLRARLVPLHYDVVKEVRPGLIVLMSAVGLVLLVACANVAHLFLVRARSREHDLAVRAALGAGRTRLAWSVLAESLIVAGLGAVLGTALAYGGLGALKGISMVRLPRLEAAQIDGTALAVVAGLAVLTALVFGLAPALQSAGVDVADALREGARTGESRGRRRLRNLLIVGEVALSLMLLVGAGLLLRSFASLQDVRPGFDPEGVLTFRIALPDTPEYGTGPPRVVFFEELQESLRGLPGAASVSGISQLPLTGSGPLQPFAYNEETARNWESVTADQRVVFPGFFRTVGAELVAGRGFLPSDDGDAPRVIVIDEQLAELAWPGEDPVGKRLQVRRNGTPNRFAEVVGVVRHLRLYDLARPHLPQIYWPYRQAWWGEMAITIEAENDPAALAGAVRERVRRLDPELPVNDLRLLSDIADDALGETRFSLLLLGAFSALALLLTAVGLYGVIAYSMSRRTRELGLRMALGASPGRVVRRAVGEGMRLVAVSIGLGLVGALALSRFLESMLYQVRPTDPLTFAAVSALMAGVAFLACWVPARRAARIDPAATLRAE